MKMGYAIIAFVVIIVLFNSLYVVDETKQAIITQFGKPVGDPVVTPGLKLKIPFVQKAHMFDRRFLEWDGNPNELPTRDKRFIWVNTYARWRITDPCCSSSGFATRREPRRASTTSSTARRATPSPSTTWSKWCGVPIGSPSRGN